MYKALLVTLFAVLTTAQITKLNKSQANVLNQALKSLESSLQSDPAWSSINSVMATATGSEGAAASYVRDGDGPVKSVTDTTAYLASLQSKFRSAVTELPTQAQAYFESKGSLESKIIASVFSAASAEAGSTGAATSINSLSQVTTTSTSSPSLLITTPTPTPTQSGSNVVAAASSSSTVVPTTGGAERMKQLGCVAAIGLLGAGAILL